MEQPFVEFFAGVFFVGILALIFSRISHQILLAVNNIEHEIQTRFKKIITASIALKQAKKESLSLLDEASQNLWKDNLSERLSNSFESINTMASQATNDTVELRKILEASKYKDIFNFTKYGNWTKKQILEPIEEIYLLLSKNHDTIKITMQSLDLQIEKTQDPSLKKPLIIQKERLEIQIQSIERVLKMLDGYKEKLTHTI